MNAEGWQILIGIGSNIDPEVHVPRALGALAEAFGEVSASTFYWTKPLKGRSQPRYMNGVVSARTELLPERVRGILAEIERECDRKRDPADRYSSRTLDLDLLLYGDLVDEARELPNPDLVERDFVLLPAAELAPDFVHPVEERPLAALAQDKFPEAPNIEARAELPGVAASSQASRLRAANVLPVLLAVLAVSAIAACAVGVNVPENPGSGLLIAAALPAAEDVDSAPSGKKGWKPLRSLVTIVLASYLGLCLLMFGCQSRFVYFPTKNLDLTPKDVGMEFEEVRLASGGGTVHGWYVPAEEPVRGTVLFCHGNGGNIGHRIETLQILQGLGFSTLIFDYRGYGQSTGRPGEKRTYEDAEAVWQYLTEERGIAPDRIVVFGRSLGGAVAAWLAREHTPGALILESTFTSVPDLGQQVYPFIPVRLLSLFRYSTAKYVAKVKCPVIVLHSPQDDIIPYAHGKRVFAAAPEPKKFIEMTGTHNEGFLVSGKKYFQGLDDALAEAGFKRPESSISAGQ